MPKILAWQCDMCGRVMTPLTQGFRFFGVLKNLMGETIAGTVRMDETVRLDKTSEKILCPQCFAKIIRYSKAEFKSVQKTAVITVKE